MVTIISVLISEHLLSTYHILGFRLVFSIGNGLASQLTCKAMNFCHHCADEQTELGDSPEATPALSGRGRISGKARLHPTLLSFQDPRLCICRNGFSRLYFCGFSPSRQIKFKMDQLQDMVQIYFPLKL